MAALTSARRRLRGVLPGQISTVHHDTFPAFSSQPPSTTPSLAINEGCRPDGSPLARRASPFSRRLAVVAGRIGFTFVRDCGSAAGCSPPRLAATQLPLAAFPLLVSGRLRLSLVDIMITTFARGRTFLSAISLKTAGWKTRPPFLGFLAGHNRPPDGHGVFEDSGLDGFVFSGCGHGYTASSFTRVFAVISS